MDTDADVREGLERLVEGSGREAPPLDGDELRDLVEGKWGKAYDTRLHRRRDGLGQMRIYLEVMWKHLYQRSFHMSEAQYMEQLDAVAELCSLWGCADEVREGIRDCKKRPVLDTVGAKAVQIPLQVPADVIEAF